jgi:arylsulfatase A-like enzyme
MTNRMQRSGAVLAAAVFGISLGCSSGSPETSPVIRLIDRFQAEMVEGSPSTRSSDPAVSWDFARESQGQDPTLGWKAGAGVSDLKIVDGKLVGRATTDFPLLYAPITQTVDSEDDFHSIDVRIRSSAEGQMIAIRSTAEELNFSEIVDRNRTATPQLSAKVAAGDAFQTLTMRSQRPATMGRTRHLLIRPVNVKGAEFAIESVRMISEREHRASVPSGIGWQGLGGIYRETIVSRSPESFAFDLDLPSGAWLDLNLGTTEPGPVTFKVTAGSGENQQTLLERTVTTPHRWEAAPVNLSGLRGSTTLRFSLAVDRDRTIGFWGTPAVRVRNTKPATQTAAAALGGTNAPRRVIFVMCDTLRKDHLGAYGHGRETAPNLAAMASEGTIFLDNVSQATWTKASTPSLMTSLYPTSTRVQGVPDRLSASATTLAEVFREAGYATVSYSSNAFTGRLTNLQQGFEELHEGSSISEPRYRSKSAREYVDRAVDWIEGHPDTPLFLFLHVFDPHHPFEPRAPYSTTFAEASLREKHEQERESVRKVIADTAMRPRGLPTPAELAKAGIDAQKWLDYEKDWYDGSILGMDAEVGRLKQRLRTLGLEKDTLLVFFSDHGEGFGEHGTMWHGYTGYGELSGVPMMFHWPGVIPPGLKIAETVRNIDLMPTVLDLSGLPIPKEAQGQSLVPLMAAARAASQGGGSTSLKEAAGALGWQPQPAVTEKSDHPDGERPRGLLSYAIISDGWKLVHNVKSPDQRPEFELYNHQDDPLDQSNVLDAHPDVAETLKSQLVSWLKMAESAELPDANAAQDVPEKELERLRSLGYVQ